jgi:ATP-dependent exoDNAse (exonuclease V) alpha subunit
MGAGTGISANVGRSNGRRPRIAAWRRYPDHGQIVKIDLVEREVTIRFDQWEVTYHYGELDEISLAYATTIHKSQP